MMHGQKNIKSSQKSVTIKFEMSKILAWSDRSYFVTAK